MILRWFLLGPSDPKITKRGGSGSGITTTREASISFGVGPPESTETKWRGIGNEPNIAGSTGGFIGLISGIAIFLILITFLGIFLRNRYKKRLPSKSHKTRNSIMNPLPSLSFSRPSTSDPYAQSSQDVEFDYELDRNIDPDSGETPKSSKFNFVKPVYTRQRSSEWELPDDESIFSDRHETQIKGKGNGNGWDEVKLPNQLDQVALPLRSRSPRLRSASPSKSHSHNPHERSNSTNSISSIGSGIKGKDQDSIGGRIINPFENPYDQSRLSPIPLRRQDSSSSLSSVGSDNPKSDMRRFRENTPTGSNGGEDSDQSIRVSQIREGSRFVERFESKESLA